jgi:type III secretory pathway lipoprotein EscJ
MSLGLWVACAPEPPSRSEPQAAARLDAVYPDVSLVPSLFEQHTRYQRAVAADLANHLHALDHIQSASVFFYQPFRSPLMSASERDAPSVSVIASVLDGADLVALRREIIEIATATLDGLEPDRLSVVLSVPPDSTAPRVERERLAPLGPFEVAASSKSALQAVAVLLLGLIVALAVWAFAAEHINASLRAQLGRLRRAPQAGLAPTGPSAGLTSAPRDGY